MLVGNSFADGDIDSSILMLQHISRSPGAWIMLLILVGGILLVAVVKRPALALRFVFAGIGALISVFLSVLAVAAIQNLYGANQFRPTLGILAAGVVGAVAGWRRAPQPPALLATLKTLPTPARTAIAISATWWPVVFIAVFEFGWLGHYWNQAEWLRLIGALIGPPIFGPALWQIWKWAISPQRADR